MRFLELEEPSGEISVPFCWKRNDGTQQDSDENDQDQETAELEPIELFCIQIAIIQNHQSGRDTHVRSVGVFRQSNVRQEAASGPGGNLGKQYVIR